MLSEDTKNKDFALAYAQKFLDAGNSVVTLMFGLAFAVYLALANSLEIRDLIREVNWLPWLLSVISLGGNALLIFVLYRLSFHEKRIVKSMLDDPEFIDSIHSAFEIRSGMLIFNTLMYIGVIWAIANTPHRSL
jgi:hypothetical protein